MPTEPVIGRAFARPVGSKTLRRKSSCPAIIGGKRGSIGERFDRRPLKTTINEAPEGLSSAAAPCIAWKKGPNKMTKFPVNTIESAPEGSKPALRQLQATFGMIPNILGVMSTSPVLINSLVGLFGNVHGGSFTEAQIQTLLLTNAVTNGCDWAVAFHTALALKEGLDSADVEAIRERR